MTEQPETTDMNELFSRDALELTDEDIDSIITHMRNRRHLFTNTATTAAGKPKKKTKAEETHSKLNLGLSL